jgi:hypothetical protein
MSQSRMKSLTKPCTFLAFYSSRWQFLSSETLLSSCHKQRVQHVSVCVRLGLSVFRQSTSFHKMSVSPYIGNGSAFCCRRFTNESLEWTNSGCSRLPVLSLFFSLSLTSSTYSFQVFSVTVAPDRTQWHTHTHSAGLLWTEDRSVAETRFITSKQNQMFVVMAECAASTVPLYKYIRVRKFTQGKQRCKR